MTKLSEFWFVTVTDKINHDTDESQRHKLALYKPVPNNDFVIRGTLPNQSFYFLFSSLCYAEINSFVPYIPVLFHIRKPSILQFHVWCNGHWPSMTSCFSVYTSHCLCFIYFFFFQFIYLYFYYFMIEFFQHLKLFLRLLVHSRPWAWIELFMKLKRFSCPSEKKEKKEVK